MQALAGVLYLVMALKISFIAALWLAASLDAQPKKTVFMITDAEGVAGVCRQDQTDPKNTEMRQLLTGEINAAVDGFLEGGADEVIVWDGHDGSQTLSALTIHPKAKLIIGNLGLTMLLERRFAGIAFIGQHARANSRGGIMAHSYSSLGIQNMLMNGKPVGEVETRAALAGAFQTPVIFLSGDQAAVADLHAIVPQAETAEVKEGLSNYACISLSATSARTLIREGAARGMRKLGQIPPYRLDGPVTFQIEYTTRNALPVDIPVGAEMLDARTVRYRGYDFMDALKRYRGR
jgi:D-amino peptidase